MEMDRTYASKGVAGTGLGLGIAGTALGVLNGMGGLLGGCNNGLLGNWSRGGCCSDDEFVTRYERAQSAQIASKDNEIALLKANIYSDQKLADVFERVTTRINSLEKQVFENAGAQAVTNQRFTDNIAFVDSKFDNVYKDIECTKKNILCYVDATFVPGKLVMPLDSICPAAQPATTPSTGSTT